METELTWLAACAEWSDLLDTARWQEPHLAFAIFQRLANTRMDFVRAGRLDKAVQRYRTEHGSGDLPVLRVALLGSSTLSHLHGGTRIGALRRGLLLDLYEGAYGQYRQELTDQNSGLHQFRPDIVCFAMDAEHLCAADDATAEASLAMLEECWTQAQDRLGCTVIQQTLLPRLTSLMGNNEDRLPHSPANLVRKINNGLREVASGAGVYLLTIDTWAASDGLSFWHSPGLWHAAKHEVHPRASQHYGEQLGRLIAALRGRSSKCLILDLDNTLWGGVIGDDGLDGIVLGQGSAAGEAYLALQRYARQLAARGVLLAVCSKNDEATACAAFEKHPEMLLRRKDISCFIANWQDKATNLREIAERLNIGLDSLVFVDDNPVERALVRRELPMVSVPELPEDPSEVVGCLAQAGYFEAFVITAEDRDRTAQYRANAEREDLRRSITDMESFLDALRMELTWTSVDPASVKRVVQLINKTNQFNLTTKRRSEAEVHSLLRDPQIVTLQIRLSDIYGDNGMVALVIARRTQENALEIDTWLMSCRVLGRQMEDATLNLIVERARNLHCSAVIGHFRPSAKNGMVREHYRRLGFDLLGTTDDGSTTWKLLVENLTQRATHMRVLEGVTCHTPISIAS